MVSSQRGDESVEVSFTIVYVGLNALAGLIHASINTHGHQYSHSTRTLLLMTLLTVDALVPALVAAYAAVAAVAVLWREMRGGWARVWLRVHTHGAPWILKIPIPFVWCPHKSNIYHKCQKAVCGSGLLLVHMYGKFIVSLSSVHLMAKKNETSPRATACAHPTVVRHDRGSGSCGAKLSRAQHISSRGN